MADIFSQVRADIEARRGRTPSHDWLYSKVRDLAGTSLSARELMRDQRDNLTNRILPGRLYMFSYDPLGKGTPGLPYYDRFPMIMPFETTSNGFIGINFHYLPPLLRLKLLEKMSAYTANASNNDVTTRIKADWAVLKNASKFKEVKPAVKRYVSSQVRSRFLWIEPEDWATAVLLPTQKFVGKSTGYVHNQSKQQMRRR
jgi:hypothetical protein